MTPKEKAQDLYSKVYGNLEKSENEIYRKTNARICALIAVYEIEAALTEYGKSSDELQNMDSEWRFWKSVEEELNNL